MTRYMIVVLMLLAGCGTTPQDLRQEGERSVHTLIRSPETAARCMVRNLENAGFGVGNTSVRALGKGVELVMAHTPETTSVIAQIEPAGTGSTATVWLQPDPFYRRAELVLTMIKGC